MPYDLFRIYILDGRIGVEVSPWVWALATLLVLIFVLLRLRRSKQPYQIVQLNIQLGSIGSVELKPNWEDVQVAHKIWTELVTRKAAIPIDPDNDVILEVYDSWYALFQRTRQLVSEIPSRCIRRERRSQTLGTISFDPLNSWTRPHL